MDLLLRNSFISFLHLSYMYVGLHNHGEIEMAFLSMSDELIEVPQANFRNNGFDIDIHPRIL